MRGQNVGVDCEYSDFGMQILNRQKLAALSA